MCTICWSADAETDVQLGARAAAMGGVKVSKSGCTLFLLQMIFQYLNLIQDSACCGYGAAGQRTDTKGYDCLMIPGATKAAFDGQVQVSQCGHDVGLITADAANAAAGKKTVCCK